MNIAYVMMDFPVKSETFACNDIRKLVEMGHNVDVYSLMGSSKEKKSMLNSRQLADLNVKYFTRKWKPTIFVALKYSTYLVHHLLFTMSSDFDSSRKKFKHIYYALPCLYHFEKSFKNSDYDVIHFFWGHYPLILADLLRKYRSEQYFTIFLGAADLSYRLPITKKIAPKVDTVFTHSDSNLDALKNLGISKDQIKVIYRGIDIDYLDTLVHFGEDENLWVTSGRLISSKRFDSSIEFFADALKQNPALRLEIIGSGPVENDLKNKVRSMKLENHISFIQWLPHRELLRTLSKASTLIFFSEKPGEKLPNIVKEAMYLECTCFVGEKSGCDELIDDGKDGLILKEGIKYKDIISKYTSEDFLTMRLNAKKKLIQKFSLRNSMQSYLDHWYFRTTLACDDLTRKN